MTNVIRPARVEDADAIALVAVTAWRETYAGIMPDEYLAALSLEHRAGVVRDHLTQMPDTHTFLVALDRDRVVGFGFAAPTRQAELGTDGEIVAINIVDAAKRRGFGARLMAAMADALSLGGFTRVGLWVIEQNLPARRFYDALGGTQMTQRTQEFGGRTLVELGYTWPTVADLREHAGRLIHPPL